LLSILDIFDEVSSNKFAEGKSFALNTVPVLFNILISLEIFKHDKNLLKKIKIIALTAICRKIIIMDIKHLDYF
jgi:hypothetical protein